MNEISGHRAVKTLFAPILGAFLFFAATAQAQPQFETPDKLVYAVTQDLMADIKANKDRYLKDRGKLYAMVDKKVLGRFDFERMSQWVLGRYWRTATPEQRQRFTQEFRALLVRTYATALLDYTGEQDVVYLPFQGKPGDQEAVVRTEIKQPSGPNIPIYYAFFKGKDGWKVYDVSVEGVSLVTNYRSAYASKIKQEGMDALIASIAASNRAKARSGDQGATPPARLGRQ